jgi:hypothetical protein
MAFGPRGPRYRTLPTSAPLRGFGGTGSRFRSLGATVIGGFKRNATLTTALAGTNNDLLYRAARTGAQGNDTRIRYVVSGASTPLSVSVSGNDITVNVATNGSSAATSTGAQVRDAVNGHATAGTMVRAENAPGNDGTGVVTALAFTNLAGGANHTIGRN